MIAAFPVTDDHQVMLISNLGQMIRTPVDTVRFTGRSASGVTLFKVGKDEKVVSVAWLVEDDDEEDVIDGEAVEAGADDATETISEATTSADPEVTEE